MARGGVDWRSTQPFVRTCSMTMMMLVIERGVMTEGIHNSVLLTILLQLIFMTFRANLTFLEFRATYVWANSTHKRSCYSYPKLNQDLIKSFPILTAATGRTCFASEKRERSPPIAKTQHSPVGLKPVREPLMISLFYKYLLYRLINSPAECKSNDCRESQGVVLGGGWFHNKTLFIFFPNPNTGSRNAATSVSPYFLANANYKRLKCLYSQQMAKGTTLDK